ncbi:unnamed protein product [Chrysoparadoxa australica]
MGSWAPLFYGKVHTNEAESHPVEREADTDQLKRLRNDLTMLATKASQLSASQELWGSLEDMRSQVNTTWGQVEAHSEVLNSDQEGERQAAAASQVLMQELVEPLQDRASQVKAEIDGSHKAWVSLLDEARGEAARLQQSAQAAHASMQSYNELSCSISKNEELLKSLDAKAQEVQGRAALALTQEQLDGIARERAQRAQAKSREEAEMAAALKQQLPGWAAEAVAVVAEEVSAPSGSLPQACVSDEDFAGMVAASLRLLASDRTGWIDYARAPGGSIVAALTSPTYRPGGSWQAFTDAIKGQEAVVGKPDEVMSSDMTPGRCWAMDGSIGEVVIRLSRPVAIESVTLEHLHPSIASDMTSAPADFSVWGYTDDGSSLIDSSSHRELILPEAVYDASAASPVQTFPIKPEMVGRVYKAVSLEVSSNGGNPLYTCIYRFRIHGR